MRLNKTAVLNFIDTALEKHKAKFDQEQLDIAAAVHVAALEWEAKYGAAWNNAITQMTLARKRGQPITEDMIPKTNIRYGNEAYFDEDDEPETYTAPRDLTTMRALINASVDDVITFDKELNAIYRKYVTA